MVLEVERRQVLAYRVAASGLLRDAREPASLGVFDLGVQDTNVGSARLAVAARMPEGCPDPMADPGFTLLWSFRGAPHLQRSAEVARLSDALWPVSDADAFARLAAERAPLKAAGIGGLEAFTTIAEALREVVTGPMTKGEVSSATTARLPAAYAYACKSCATTHVYGGLFQQAGLFAGVRLLADHSPATLAPLDGGTSVPSAAEGTPDLVAAYLRLHGPARLSDAAAYLGTNPTALRPSRPPDLAEVAVEGRSTLIPADQLDALRSFPPVTDLLRLLPPSDPYLQARDRPLLVPGEAHRKALWRALASPGAVLVDGEVAGMWRARMSDNGRLAVTVEAFSSLSARRQAELEGEAERMGRLRRAADVQVRYQ